MNRALRHLSLVTQRHRHLVLVLVGLALIDQWLGLALWIAHDPSYLQNGHPIIFVLAMSLSVLIIVLGAVLYAVLGNVRVSEHELARMATTDLLTGVLNRRGFMGAAAQEFSRAVRYDRPLSVLSVDLDVFKGVNDAHGHAAGDAVLQAFAAAWQNVLRTTDSIGRTGGEEFAILLPETAMPQARELAERVRNACERHPFPFLPAGASITVSVGVAAIMTGDSSIEHALARADGALYRAKTTGRNRVESAE